jgi:isopenicillin-N N-acyltransferase-like protein
MNRKLDDHIPLEYLREIYGVSLQASESYSFIGPPYQRIMDYHAAHDIGHALQNMNLVACTAIGVSGSRSADGQLLVGRNFDFSMGDDFARNKIIAFYRPDHGYSFASISWGGMIGVVSGMNDQGLVVTLNAAKSGIPKSAKTPTSILARQILQYASTIEEAFELASQSETFVAESFLISSAKDGKTVVIEKSPLGLDIYDPGDEMLVLTNHFQGEKFRNSELTLRNMEEGSSVYRWERARELLERTGKHDEETFAKILRDRLGRGDADIGMGNEKSVNQLIAHHSVIFKPMELKIWVSAFPYSLGAYLCYDLNEVFADSAGIYDQLYIPEETIDEDPFLASREFRDYLEYRQETRRIRIIIEESRHGEAEDPVMERYLALNPNYYYPYFLAGEYYRVTGNIVLADEMYKRSLSLEIPRKVDRKSILEAREVLHQ